jgi:DNA modification methylase
MAGKKKPTINELQRVQLTSLVPHPRNVRRGVISAIADSLQVHGQYKPIIVQASTGHILVGNHTWLAAQSLGWDEIDVVYVEVSDDEALRILLVDNKSTDHASYDEMGLAELLAQLSESELGLVGTGYSDSELSELLGATLVPEELLTDADDVPAAAVPRTSSGDVWLLGSHRVKCGDSTSVTDMDDLMCAGSADMVWTDPPYGVAIVGGNHSLSPAARLAAGGLTIDNDDLDADQLEQFLRDALGNAAIHSRAGAAWFVAAPAGPLFIPFGNVLRDEGIWRQTLVWLKSSIVMGRSDYHYRHEAIFYGWKPGAAHTPPPDRKGDTIWEFDKPSRNAEHPTMKPVALIERAINNHSKVGDLILDPFGGSGSTLIACVKTGRVARLMELDPKYVDVICARFQKATGVQPILESTGEVYDFVGVEGD